MLIDYNTFDSAKAITLAEARPLIRGRRGHVALEVLRRWHNRGCPVNGQKLYLPAVRMNGHLLTMPEWIASFEKERARLSVRQPSQIRTRAERSAGHQAAMAKLRAMGV